MGLRLLGTQAVALGRTDCPQWVESRPWNDTVLPMTERYEPPSEFLKALIHDDAALVGGEEGEANLRRLMDMMRDELPANRDWATLLLAPRLRTAKAAEIESLGKEGIGRAFFPPGHCSIQIEGQLRNAAEYVCQRE